MCKKCNEKIKNCNEIFFFYNGESIKKIEFLGLFLSKSCKIFKLWYNEFTIF